MNISLVIGALFFISVILGYIKYRGNVYWYYDYEKDQPRPREKAPQAWRFIEVWNCSVNFFLAGLVGYYFVIIRWNYISKGEALSLGDFALLFIFAMCLFGQFPHLLKNITEGINAILKRVLEKN